LRHQARGSMISGENGGPAASALIGQAFTDSSGNPIPWYFQSRPSAAGNGYDPTASAAGNLGPGSTVDDLAAGRQSLLTQICARSKQVGELERVDGSRPYCTPDGTGAVLGVFHTDGLTGPVTRVVSLDQACPTVPFLTNYDGVRVECARPGADYSHAVLTPIRGNAPAQPVVPPDAVTGSGSGLDPDISVAYARLQEARIARERGIPPSVLQQLVDQNTTDRPLGVLGEPAVNVVTLNLALDRNYPQRTA
jgi:potassium-transporting ATPase KdpC subunit